MADSYNELLGLGSHSAPGDIIRNYFLQDDAASTAVDDSSPADDDGVLTGGDNTSDISASGPNSYLTKGLDFDGTADYVTTTLAATIPTTGSLLFWLHPDNAWNSGVREFVGGSSQGGGSTKEFSLQIFTDDRLYWGWKNGAIDTRVIVERTPSNWLQSQWQRYVLTWTSGGNSILYHNGSQLGTAANTSTFTPSQNFYIASETLLNTHKFNGRIAGMVMFNRVLTSAERSEWATGPEATYSSGASLDEDGNYDVGTWELPSPFSSGSNGTVTFEAVAANAAGTVVDSATGSSGTLNLTSASGNTVYLLARATNSGGYDIGDKATRTSGYGSTDDGYYELASVVVTFAGPARITAVNLATASVSAINVAKPSVSAIHVEAVE